VSLESKDFLASPTDIEKITRDVMQAQATGSSGRASYLKALAAVTRQELGMGAVRKHPQPVTHEERARHTDALEAVDKRFYAIVLRTIGDKCSAIERNRRSNFARSARSMLLSWIRAGNDIAALDPARVTKASLVVDTRARRLPSTHILTKQANRYIEHFEGVLEKMAEADEDAAAETLKEAVEHFQELHAQLTTGKRRPVRARSRQQDGHHSSA
jgi:molybdenum-dependent DNA-binding transcriptional regulator ModE